jgi:hypothetical protein
MYMAANEHVRLSASAYGREHTHKLDSLGSIQFAEASMYADARRPVIDQTESTSGSRTRTQSAWILMPVPGALSIDWLHATQQSTPGGWFGSG